MQRKYLAVVISWLVMTSTLSAATTTLDFNAPVPGTLTDANGLGTGFTTRLPGTGSAIPANDPNLTLDTANSQLIVRSTYSSPNYAAAGYQNNAANLPAMEMPALLLSGIGNGDFIIQARFNDLHVDNASDQIGVFAGASINNMVRGGVYQLDIPQEYQSGFQISQNGLDNGGGNLVPAIDTFQPGQNGEFELGRINGVWHFSWQNLSNPSNSGTFATFTVPGLDSLNDLYIGVFNLDPYGVVDVHTGIPSTPYNAYLDSFTVLTGASVPEPSSVVLLGLGASSLFVGTRHRRRGGQAARAKAVRVR